MLTDVHFFAMLSAVLPGNVGNFFCLDNNNAVVSGYASAFDTA